MVKLAKGTKLLIGDGAEPEGFTAVSSVVEFQPPANTWTMEDTTPHDDETKVTTCAKTVRTVSALTLTVKPFDINNPQHERLEDLSLSGAINNFKLTYPGSTLGTMGPF